jgi:hypothetical protein
MSLVRYGTTGSGGIELTRHRCPACGVEFNRNPARDDAQTRCEICRKTNHHAGLFQVITDT